jgi:hypothetical protein
LKNETHFKENHITQVFDINRTENWFELKMGEYSIHA